VYTVSDTGCAVSGCWRHDKLIVVKYLNVRLVSDEYWRYGSETCDTRLYYASEGGNGCVKPLKNHKAAIAEGLIRVPIVIYLEIYWSNVVALEVVDAGVTSD